MFLLAGKPTHVSFSFYSTLVPHSYNSILPFTFRELGIGIVPYSPIGRGFLAEGSKLIENLSTDDFRKVGVHYIHDICFFSLMLYWGK